jgi:hypothetical protein
MNPSNPESDLWCNGLPFKERRMLSDTERLELLRRMASAERKYRFGYWASCVVRWITLISLIASIAMCVQDKNDNSNAAMLAMAIVIFLPAIGGVLQEIIIGYNNWVRFILIPVLVLFVVGVVLSNGHSLQGAMDIAMGVSAGIILFGGWIFLLMRWRIGLELREPLKQALLDVKQGEVLVFENECSIESEKRLPRIELLPNSQFLYRLNDNLVEKLEVLRSVSVSKAKGLSVPMDLGNVPQEVLEQDLEYFRRTLTDSELAELKRISNRQLRRAFIQSLGTLWITAQVVRLIENIFNRHFDPGLSGPAWLLVILVGLLVWWINFRVWLRLRLDIKERVILSARRKGTPIVDDPLEECLSESKLVWSQEGKPTGWRTSWW